MDRQVFLCVCVGPFEQPQRVFDGTDDRLVSVLFPWVRRWQMFSERLIEARPTTSTLFRSFRTTNLLCLWREEYPGENMAARPVVISSDLLEVFDPVVDVLIYHVIVEARDLGQHRHVHSRGRRLGSLKNCRLIPRGSRHFSPWVR